MNEPKRRGRPPKAQGLASLVGLRETTMEEFLAVPPKAQIASFPAGNGVPVDMDKPIQFYHSPAPCDECGQAEGHYDDCPAGMGATVAAFNALEGIVSPTRTPLMDGAVFTQRKAQAYANRVWAGQSPDVKHEERVARVKRALEAQNLPFEGVVLP